ncbi:MAG: hypothetical protein HY454_01015, partial [Parcubacteria group bacterium]|nr:hypothetical protein [Parcubacteria group bacterium]
MEQIKLNGDNQIAKSAEVKAPNGFSPKKFLFVSWESLSGDLAWQIQKE